MVLKNVIAMRQIIIVVRGKRKEKVHWHEKALFDLTG